MSVKVYIPTPFRRLTGNQARVEASAGTVGELLVELEGQFPGLRERLRDASGSLLGYINIYVNSEEIADQDGEATVLKDGDEVSIIPAVAGGDIMTEEQVKRYSRHLLLSEVGPIGQRKLLNAKVLLIGAGGLGSPAALYLAAAGVGTLGVVDFDVVDHSNLQRQILHQTKDVGTLKVESARESISAMNPNVKVEAHNMILDSSNALELFSQYDIIVNGVDNFPARYLANDAAVMLKKPMVDGGINQFEGMVSVYSPGTGCYRCLYENPPPPGAVPSCAEAGVLGVLPGIVGSLQALETIKLILGIGEPLIGRLLLIDTLSMDFRVLKTRRNPGCPACGDNPSITELIDYHEYCGLPIPEELEQQRAQESHVVAGANGASGANGAAGIHAGGTNGTNGAAAPQRQAEAVGGV
ncbi:MAG: Molybdopterin-synthase adenylyltransferase [uncultured Chloroflexi bacterium]|uniref:Molybdopterin-synthase adenylyltransferase n=1 Tax=uncultured Chloroflexota bacterium TaxID=166587 RepID=A0A6J4IQL4_9CHLR|nr:MAG: Molybdopterin-synthase adenylyltransferase [uncultured Chloroflexota bacterium]